MPTLADLVEELEEQGVGLDEIQIPRRWYQRIIDCAEELADLEEGDS